jgi:nicotinamidase-related amidase
MDLNIIWRHTSMLTADNAVLTVIDTQEKLVNVMHKKEELIDNVQKLIKGVQVFNIPIILTEQYPKGLGTTIPEIADLLHDVQPISKLCFSCCIDPNFVKKLEATGRKQVLVAGIETHVCVYQTVRDLLSSGYEVFVITDTVSSRTPENRDVALNLMQDMGAFLTSTEIVLFEMLKTAGTESFKAISRIVK